MTKALSSVQNFYKASVAITTGAGAGKIYVDILPSVSTGYAIFSPSNSSKREIVYFDSKGTDVNGNYINIASTGDRGLGGTTAQIHSVLEPIRINITSLHWDDVISAINAIIAGSLVDSSKTVKGTGYSTENLGSRPRFVTASVSQQSTPNMTLKVNPFSASSMDKDVVYAGGNTPTIVAPASNPRIDLIVYDTVNSVIAVRAGTENASPTKPTPTSGDIVLASVYLRVGTTALYETDQTTNGYIQKWYTPTLYGSSTPAGIISPYAGSSAPSGWLLCQGQAVSRTTYASLFAILSTTYGTGDGSTTFNLPDLRARTPIGIGAVTKVATFASRSSNVITVTGLSNTSSNEFQTGQMVRYSTSGSVITGLTNNTDYYLVRTGNLTFSLATTLANAQNGTVISLSSDGSGTQTFTLTLTTRTLGETGGEETHAMSSTELLSHTHTPYADGMNTGSGYPASTTSKGSTPIANPAGLYNGNTGGNQAMNNMQPFIGVNYIIKT